MTNPLVRPRRSRWPWYLAAFCFVQYTIAGWWLMSVRNYAIFDSMYRTLYAKQMVLSRDPHLASMGFYWMPLPTVIRVPFVILTNLFGHAELAGPLTSALFAALLVVLVARTAELLRLSRPMTILIVCLFAFSPITIYLGANGMSESTFGFFTALTVYFFLKWRADGRPTTLILMAVALAGSTMCRYEGLLFVPVLGIAVALCVPKGRRLQLALLVGFPAVVVFAWWTLASALIMGDPFFWRTASKATTARPTLSPWLPSSQTALPLTMHSVMVVGVLAPAFVAIIAGVISSPKRWRTSWGVVGVALAMPAVVTLQLIKGESWGVPRFYVLSPIFAVLGVMWVVRMGRDHATTKWIGYLGVVLLGVGAITGSVYLSTRGNSYAEGEFAFFGPLLGRQTASASVAFDGPNIVYSGDLRPYRTLKGDLDPWLAKGAKAATQSLSISLLLTDEPKQYLAPEDRDFEVITSDPIGRFDFVVLQPNKISAGEQTLAALVARPSPEGEWLLARRYGDGVLELYEWVPTGRTPRLATPEPEAKGDESSGAAGNQVTTTTSTP